MESNSIAGRRHWPGTVTICTFELPVFGQSSTFLCFLLASRLISGWFPSHWRLCPIFTIKATNPQLALLSPSWPALSQCIFLTILSLLLLLLLLVLLVLLFLLVLAVNWRLFVVPESSFSVSASLAGSAMALIWQDRSVKVTLKASETNVVLFHFLFILSFSFSFLWKLSIVLRSIG